MNTSNLYRASSLGGNWITVIVNTISVNHPQHKLISDFQNTSYFQPKFVETFFSIGLVI